MVSDVQGVVDRSQRGFTLLEVMVSVAIIGIALVSLIGSQSQSVSIAASSRFETTASLLAQQKLTELALAGFDELRSTEGDFGDDFPGYRWEIEVRDLGVDDTGIEGADDMLRSVDLIISTGLDEDLRFGVREIMMAPIEAKEGA
ncbi:MAG: prepilin-type N-terminal cleavage/methylation domain-containing protein [Desulfobulbaceae bacterium]|nr:prepilin-type N-terminal cleavage/methylation domain-containing protein [Desulfobulbaceae bacterium]